MERRRLHGICYYTCKCSNSYNGLTQCHVTQDKAREGLWKAGLENQSTEQHCSLRNHKGMHEERGIVSRSEFLDISKTALILPLSFMNQGTGQIIRLMKLAFGLRSPTNSNYFSYTSLISQSSTHPKLHGAGNHVSVLFTTVFLSANHAWHVLHAR